MKKLTNTYNKRERNKIYKQALSKFDLSIGFVCHAISDAMFLLFNDNRYVNYEFCEVYFPELWNCRNDIDPFIFLSLGNDNDYEYQEKFEQRQLMLMFCIEQTK